MRRGTPSGYSEAARAPRWGLRQGRCNVLHASHNLSIQAIFTPMTGTASLTPYLIGEFGAGLALVALPVVLGIWRSPAAYAYRPVSQNVA
jgi:hypothetical protein